MSEIVETRYPVAGSRFMHLACVTCGARATTVVQRRRETGEGRLTVYYFYCPECLPEESHGYGQGDDRDLRPDEDR